MKVTPEQLAKLPKWAQEHIADLDRRAVLAERTLTEMIDNETPSPIYYEEYLHVGAEGTGRFVRNNVQTHKMTFEHKGVVLEVLLPHEDPHIRLSWRSDNRLTSEVAMVPTGFNGVNLIAKENMR